MFNSYVTAFTMIFPSFVLVMVVDQFFLGCRGRPIMRTMFGKLHPTMMNLLTTTTLILVGTRGFNDCRVSLCRFVVDVVVFLMAFVNAQGCGVGPVLVVVLYKITKFLLC